MVHVDSSSEEIRARAIAVDAEAKSVCRDWREGVGHAQPCLVLKSLKWQPRPSATHRRDEPQCVTPGP